MQLAAVERGHRGIVIDDAAARKIDQYSAIAHQRDTIGINDPACRVNQRHVARDKVRVHEQLVQRLFLFNPRRQLPGITHRYCRVVTHDVHAQIERRVGHLDAD